MVLRFLKSGGASSAKSRVSDWKSNGAIDRPSMEQALGPGINKLPKDYLAFAEACNGGAGFIGSEFVNLWRVEEILPSNDECQAPHYAPGLLLFGSNGANEFFGFDLRTEDVKIVMVPMIVLGWGDTVVLGNDLAGFFSRIVDDTL